MRKTASEIASLIGGTLVGDGDVTVSDVCSIDSPSEGSVSFVDSEKYLPAAAGSPLSLFLVPEGVVIDGKTVIQIAQPKMAFGRLMLLFHPPETYEPGIHPTAVIGRDAKIGQGATVCAHAVVGDGARIGARSVIREGVSVGKNVRIGKESVLFPGVTLYAGTAVGDRVRIHSGAVLGSDGFGYVESEGSHVKVPQVGNVVVEDDVEIGANTCIDRAAMGTTRIGRGTKVDNLVQVAHNVEIGEHTIVCGQAGISGSSTVGDRCILAGQVGLGDHVRIGNRVVIGAQAGFPSGKMARDGEMYLGSPARLMEITRRMMGAWFRLPAFMERFSRLAKRVKEMEEEIRRLRKGD